MSAIRTYCNTVLLAVIGFATDLTAAEFVYDYEDDPVHEDSIPHVVDLQADGKRALQAGIPVMIEFSTQWCEYCRALEAQVLEPMLRSGEYDDRVILRKVLVDDYDTVIGFDGNRMSSTRLGHEADVELYPTLVFFDGNGDEVAGRIVGITVMDYIPQKIDKALELARGELSSTRSGENRSGGF